MLKRFPVPKNFGVARNRASGEAGLGHAGDDLSLVNMPVVKDLVPDTTHLFAQYAMIEPWLKSKTPASERERLQSPEERSKLDGYHEMHPLLLLHVGLPQPLVERRPLPGACRAVAGVALAG